MNFGDAMLPFPVNLGESYSVRFQLSMDFVRQINSFRQGTDATGADGTIIPASRQFTLMDFVRQINSFRQGTDATGADGTIIPASRQFTFGHPYIQTIFRLFFHGMSK